MTRRLPIGTISVIYMYEIQKLGIAVRVTTDQMKHSLHSAKNYNYHYNFSEY